MHTRPALIRASEVAERCGVTLRTVQTWTAAGRLKSYALGRRCRRYDPRDVERFLEQARQG